MRRPLPFCANLWAPRLWDGLRGGTMDFCLECWWCDGRSTILARCVVCICELSGNRARPFEERGSFLMSSLLWCCAHLERCCLALEGDARMIAVGLAPVERYFRCLWLWQYASTSGHAAVNGHVLGQGQGGDGGLGGGGGGGRGDGGGRGRGGERREEEGLG